MSEKINWILLVAVTGCILFFCISRDIHLEKQYTGDLRNRVVGSRLQKDGRLPYFYKWSAGDGLRYYDPQNFDQLAVSNITATPFTHELLYPIADLPQRYISKIWLVTEYVSLLLIVLLALSFAKSRTQQWAVIFFSGIFLFTAGWENHIQGGQYYLFIPALSMLFYYLVNRKAISSYFIAGIVASSLVLIRPNAIWFFIPFIFIFFSWPFRYKIAFFSAAFLPLLFTVAGSKKIAYWNDFNQALLQQVKAHQGSFPVLRNNAADPGFAQWEGWDKQQVAAEAALHPFHFESEHGNFFVVSRWLFHVNLPVWLLILFPVLFLLIVLLSIYKMKKKNDDYSLFPIAVLASCLYMLSDISSPFHRFQYNTVQWLFPLLLAAAYFNKQYKWLYAMLVTGVLLNIIEIRSIGFEHTAGEYLILLAMTILGYRHATTNDLKINAVA